MCSSDEEEPGPSTGRKRVATSKFKPSKCGRGGKRQSDRTAATIVAPEATPPQPLMRQVPAVTRGIYPIHLNFPTQPHTKYLQATGGQKLYYHHASSMSFGWRPLVPPSRASSTQSIEYWSILLSHTQIHVLMLTLTGFRCVRLLTKIV